MCLIGAVSWLSYRSSATKSPTAVAATTSGQNVTTALAMIIRAVVVSVAESSEPNCPVSVTLVERGPEAAQNFYERMRVLGLSKADVDAAAVGALRDLQRDLGCSLCRSGR
jgi:hypothetical protein